MRNIKNTSSLDSEQKQHPPGTVELFSVSELRDGGGKIATLAPKPSDSPNDPLAWSMWRKCFNYGLLAAMTVCILTGLHTQHLFWALMRKEMNATSKQLVQAKGILHGAEAVSCCFIIPYATKYGRRLVYIISTAVFTSAVWWTVYMKTVPELYITNMLIGIAGAVNETAVQMSICDLFFVHQRGTANSIYFIAMKLGHYLTPLAAGAQATTYGWRSSYQTLAASMTVITVLFVLSFEETKFVRSSKVSFQGSLENVELECKDSVSDSIHTAQVPTAAESSFPHYLRLQLLTPTDQSIWKLFYRPLFTLAIPHVLFTALVFGIGLGLIGITSSMKSIIFSEPPYNFNPRQLGLMYLGPLVGASFGCLYGGYLNDKMIVALARRNKGIFEPEMRLYSLPLPAITMAAGLATFGITADRGMHWIYPIIGSGLSTFGLTATSNISFTLLIDSYSDIASQAFIVVALFRNGVGFISSFILTPWRESMTTSWMFILAAALSLIIMLMAIPLALTGKRLRAATASRYTHLSQKCN